MQVSGSQVARVAWQVAYVAALALGTALAAWGIGESVRLAGHEYWEHTFFRAVWSIPLLGLTVAYVVPAFRFSMTWRGLPFFAASYVLLGITVDYHMHLIVKKFAPDEPTLLDYAKSVGKITLMLAGCVVLAVNHYRAARRANQRVTTAR
jgi:hypothetical protein